MKSHLGSVAICALVVIGCGLSDDDGDRKTTLYLRNGAILSAEAPSPPDVVTDSIRLGASSEWVIVLDGDLRGTSYSLRLWALTEGTTFDAEILARRGATETVLAQWTGVSTSTTYAYEWVALEASGPDPDTFSGDKLVFRVTAANSTDWVYVQFDHPDANSSITVGELTSSQPGAVLDLSALAGTRFITTVGGPGFEDGTYSIVTDTDVYKDVYQLREYSLGVTVHNDSIFIIGRYGADWLSRFELSNLYAPVYRYPTNDAVETNPLTHDVTIVNDDIAYVLRFGSTDAWIVDPSPADQASFKIGTIDLSAFSTGGNPPNPARCIVDGTTMYMLLQRTNGWAYNIPGQLLVYDVSDAAAPSLVDEHVLEVVCPANMVLYGSDLYVAGQGKIADLPGDQTPSGGIEKVDLSGGVGNISSYVLVEDGLDVQYEPYLYGGATADVAVVDAGLGYIFFEDWWSPVLKIHPFNPTTGVVDTSLIIMNDKQASAMKVNSSGDLIVSSTGGPVAGTGIYEIRSTDYQVTGPISVGTAPQDFSFNE